eukprot:1148082-Pelagomonas_calceolata.AAC.4
MEEQKGAEHLKWLDEAGVSHRCRTRSFCVLAATFVRHMWSFFEGEQRGAVHLVVGGRHVAMSVGHTALCVCSRLCQVQRARLPLCSFAIAVVPFCVSPCVSDLCRCCRHAMSIPSPAAARAAVHAIAVVLFCLLLSCGGCVGAVDVCCSSDRAASDAQLSTFPPAVARCHPYTPTFHAHRFILLPIRLLLCSPFGQHGRKALACESPPHSQNEVSPSAMASRAQTGHTMGHTVLWRMLASKHLTCSD